MAFITNIRLSKSEKKERKLLKEKILNSNAALDNDSLQALRAQAKAQDKAVKAVQAARNEYEDIASINKCISAYETYVLDNEAGVRWDPSDYVFLAGLYTKIGATNKAWGLLNSIKANFPNASEAVRHQQVALLKKEKRWADALQFYCSEAYYICKRDKGYSKEQFVCTAAPLARKANLSSDQLQTLAAQIVEAAHKFTCTEGRVNEIATSFLSSNGVTNT